MSNEAAWDEVFEWCEIDSGLSPEQARTALEAAARLREGIICGKLTLRADCWPGAKVVQTLDGYFLHGASEKPIWLGADYSSAHSSLAATKGEYRRHLQS